MQNVLTGFILVSFYDIPSLSDVHQ